MHTLEDRNWVGIDVVEVQENANPKNTILQTSMHSKIEIG